MMFLVRKSNPTVTSGFYKSALLTVLIVFILTAASCLGEGDPERVSDGASNGALKNPQPAGSSNSQEFFNPLKVQKESPLLAQALKDLREGNELTVRDAIRRISTLSSSPNIAAAVDPLIQVFEDSAGGFDFFTRSMAGNCLALIAKEQNNYHKAGRALDALTNVMFNDPRESIRASAAAALGQTGYAEMIPLLERCVLVDQSPLVQSAAKNSITELSKSRLGAAATRSAPTALSKETLATDRSTDSTVGQSEDQLKTCLMPEEIKWMKDHVIMLGSQEPLLPACEEAEQR